MRMTGQNRMGRVVSREQGAGSREPSFHRAAIAKSKDIDPLGHPHPSPLPCAGEGSRPPLPAGEGWGEGFNSSALRYNMLGVALAVIFALSGCMLVSGELTSADTPAAGGNLSTSFVSAEGSETRTLETGSAGNVDVITIVSADEGTLTVELLDPAGSVIYAVSSRPREPVTKSGSVPTDDVGRLRYRVSATGARNGGLQILYQRGN